MTNCSVIYLISIPPSLGVKDEKNIIKGSLSHFPFVTIDHNEICSFCVSFPVADVLRRPPSRQSLGTAGITYFCFKGLSDTSQVGRLLGRRQYRCHQIRRMKGSIV